MKIHPLLGIDLDEWFVVAFPTTVELTNKSTGKVVYFPKPYKPMPVDWWKEQAAKAIKG